MGTPEITIMKAYRESYRTRGQVVAEGWHLIINGEWAQTFPTKREAREAANEARRIYTR